MNLKDIKPKKPSKPNRKDFPEPKEPNAVNYKKEPIYVNYDYINALKKYDLDVKAYQSKMEEYEQLKLIRLIKNSTDDYCLRKLHIKRK